MSGGSFDYSSYALEAIAEQMRAKLTHGGLEAHGEDLDESNPALNLPAVAAWLPPILEQLRELVQEVDHHLAHDSYIADEDAWLAEARAKLAAMVQA